MHTLTALLRRDSSHTAVQILSQNTALAKKNLSLTSAEAEAIARRHTLALQENRLFDLDGGIPLRILEEFSDSPYVDRANLAEVAQEMTEAFCYLKREAEGEISDRAVIHAMRQMFDGVSCGSLELFLGRELEILLRYIRENRLGEDGLPDYTIREEDDYGAKPDTSY